MKESNKNNINIYEENDETDKDDKELDEKRKFAIIRTKATLDFFYISMNNIN